jgi:uncharacterized coiled-coil protein SlyX
MTKQQLEQRVEELETANINLSAWLARLDERLNKLDGAPEWNDGKDGGRVTELTKRVAKLEKTVGGHDSAIDDLIATAEVTA